MDGSTPRRLRPTPFLAFALVAMTGCSRPAVKIVAQPKARMAQTASVVTDSEAGAPQQRAQRTWCTYLEALYARSTKDGTSWGRLDECLAETSAASPVMLQHTAECSRQALDGFDGDPLTAEYAGKVRRCGSDAIEASALSQAELERIVATICERAAACGGGTYADCRIAFDGHMETRLGRAVGAINAESRDKLRACLRVATCDEPTSDRIGGCLEPIMDRLLWLPPGTER